jgi:hypothetical protein
MDAIPRVHIGAFATPICRKNECCLWNLLTFPLCCFDQISCWLPRNTRLCTKNPVSTLTHRSIRPFRSHCEGFFATKEACFYSKKFYEGTTFGAKPEYPMKAHKNQWLLTMPSPRAIPCEGSGHFRAKIYAKALRILLQ